MVAASNLLQNNIRDQQREAERLESELDSLKESIAKSSTKLANVRAFSWIFMLFALLYWTLTSSALCIKYDLFIHGNYVDTAQTGHSVALGIKTVTEIFTNMFSIRYLAIATFHIYNLDAILVEQE